MGDEGSENLEAKVREKTREIVKADEDWTRLSGTRSIDSSVFGSFMFQSDAGTGCSIQVTENESLPVRILIDRDWDFSMFLVVVLPHEEWTTSGKFYLRFLRRVPVSEKRCTVGIEVPSEEPDRSSSDSGMSSTEEPESSIAGARYVMDGKERRLAFRIRSPNAPLPAQRPFNPLFEDAYVVPVASQSNTNP